MVHPSIPTVPRQQAEVRTGGVAQLIRVAIREVQVSETLDSGDADRKGAGATHPIPPVPKRSWRRRTTIGPWARSSFGRAGAVWLDEVSVCVAVRY